MFCGDSLGVHGSQQILISGESLGGQCAKSRSPTKPILSHCGSMKAESLGVTGGQAESENHVGHGPVEL